jgi:hypothetical protein
MVFKSRKGGYIFLFPETPSPALQMTEPLTELVPLIFFTWKAARAQLDHSLSCLNTFIWRIGYKRLLNYTTAPSVYLHVIDRENLTIAFAKIQNCFIMHSQLLSNPIIMMGVLQE